MTIEPVNEGGEAVRVGVGEYDVERVEIGADQVALWAANRRVLLLRLNERGDHEAVGVTAVGGTAAGATEVAVPWPVNAWALRGFDLLLEFDPASAARLGLTRDVALHLGISPAERARLRDALLEILASECHAIDGAGE